MYVYLAQKYDWTSGLHFFKTLSTKSNIQISKVHEKWMNLFMSFHYDQLLTIICDFVIWKISIQKKNIMISTKYILLCYISVFAIEYLKRGKIDYHFVRFLHGTLTNSFDRQIVYILGNQRAH